MEKVTGFGKPQVDISRLTSISMIKAFPGGRGLLLNITCEDLACFACRVSGHRPRRQAFGPRYTRARSAYSTARDAGASAPDRTVAAIAAAHGPPAGGERGAQRGIRGWVLAAGHPPQPARSGGRQLGRYFGDDVAGRCRSAEPHERPPAISCPRRVPQPAG